jgi:hypothetical protein
MVCLWASFSSSRAVEAINAPETLKATAVKIKNRIFIAA